MLGGAEHREMYTPLIQNQSLSPRSPVSNKSSSNGDQVVAGEQYLSMVMPDQDMEVTARIGGPKFNKDAFARNQIMGATLLLTGTGLQKSQKSNGAPPSVARAKLASFLPQLPGT